MRSRLGTAAALVGVVALAATAAASASKPPASPPLRGAVKIAFSGEGRQVLDDYKQWIFQADQECYYDKLIKETATYQWKTSFSALQLARLAKPGRALSGAGTTASGAASGQEVRNDCGSDDVPPGWVETITCAQNLQFSGAGSLRVARGKPGTAVLVVRAPAASLASPTVCALIPRGSELVARAKVSLAKLAALAPGKSMALRAGTVSELSCNTHPAPYEGTEVTDDCHDTLSWRGAITLVKS
jgi:hypothetical protein